MVRNGTYRTVVLALLCLLINGVWTTPELRAQDQPFYAGKTIRIIVGGGAGGFNDSWGRLFARHMGKYIPGSPDFIVQNMPGAGSVAASNYVYSKVKPDGLTILMPTGTIYLPQLVGKKEIQYDVRKFKWLGAQEKIYQILYMRADAPYRNIKDIIEAKEPPKCGSTGFTSAGRIVPIILERTIGAKFHVVAGYQGGPSVDLAVERGEMTCRAMTGSSHFGREPFLTWHKKDFDRHIVQTGRKRDPRAADTPTIYELMEQYKTPKAGRRVARVMLADGDFGRPFTVGPGVSNEKVRILRTAYAKALRDPALLAEAKKRRMGIEPSTGEELQAFAKEIMDQPAEVLEQAKKILGM